MHQVCGQLLLAQQHDAEAEYHLTQALTLDPSRPEPHFYLGMLAEQQGNPAQARTRYEQALALAPQFALAANNLAWLYAEHGGDLTRAAALAEMAREHLPRQAQVLDTLGWIYYKQKSFARAIPLLQQSVQLAPSNPTLHFHLGMAYYQTGDIAAARRALEQALALDVHTPNAEAIRRVLAAVRP
jgi:Flp pilus assembly protein TadD